MFRAEFEVDLEKSEFGASERGRGNGGPRERVANLEYHQMKENTLILARRRTSRPKHELQTQG